MKPVAIPMKNIAQNITIKVKIKGYRQWVLKVWVARQLFKLGAFIANINICFEKEE